MKLVINKRIINQSKNGFHLHFKVNVSIQIITFLELGAKPYLTPKVYAWLKYNLTIDNFSIRISFEINLYVYVLFTIIQP